MKEHIKNYKSAIKPLTDERDEVSIILIDSWQTFVTECPGNFHDFTVFMEDETYREVRENTRPFLQSLESHRANQQTKGRDVIDSVKRLTIEKGLANPQKQDLEVFIEEIKDGNPAWVKSKINESMLSWMQLLSGNPEINNGKIVKSIFDLGIFPSDLENYFKTYLDYYLSKDALSIKKALGAFKAEQIKYFSLDVRFLSQNNNKRNNKTENFRVLDVEFSEAEDEKPAITYISSFDDSCEKNSTEKYVQDKVRITRTDSALREDLIEIVRQLEQDPYGLGAGKLKGDIHYVVDKKGRKIYQMYFRPHRIPGLNFRTSESERYRAIYHIEPLENSERLVVVDDLLHHNDFDKKYTF